MHVLTKRPFVEAAQRFPNQRKAVLNLYRVLNRNSAKFSSPEDMRRLFPSLDNFIYKDK